MADELTEKQIVDGSPLEFEIGDRTFYVRQPTTEEYDDAQVLHQGFEGKWRARPEVKEMADVPCSEGERVSFMLGIKEIERQISEIGDSDKDKVKAMRARVASLYREIDSRTLADEVVAERALIGRDRYLTRILLLDADQKPMFPPGKAGDAAWEKFPLKAKDAVRPYVWRVVRAIEDAPFV